MTWSYLERLPALKKPGIPEGIAVGPSRAERGIAGHFSIPLYPPSKKGDFKPPLLKGSKGGF